MEYADIYIPEGHVVGGAPSMPAEPPFGFEQKLDMLRRLRFCNGPTNTALFEEVVVACRALGGKVTIGINELDAGPRVVALWEDLYRTARSRALAVSAPAPAVVPPRPRPNDPDVLAGKRFMDFDLPPGIRLPRPTPAQIDRARAIAVENRWQALEQCCAELRRRVDELEAAQKKTQVNGVAAATLSGVNVDVDTCSGRPSSPAAKPDDKEKPNAKV